MTSEESHHPDLDMQNVLPALIRAGKRAREIARQTRTEYVIFHDGKIISEIPPLIDEKTVCETAEDPDSWGQK